MDPNIIVGVEEEAKDENPDNDAINADDMTNRIEILSQLRNKVVEEGVCRDDVEGMNSVLRGFSEEVPSTESYFYTQDRSRMNVVAALEAIDNGIMSMIRRFVAAIIRYVQNGFQFLRRLFKQVGTIVDRAQDYEDAVKVIQASARSLEDMVGDKNITERIYNSVTSTMRSKFRSVYAIAKNPVHEGRITALFETWNDVNAIAEAAIDAAPAVVPEFESIVLDRDNVQALINQLSEPRLPDAQEILTFSFDQFASGKELYEKSYGFETHMRAIERAMKAKFTSQFFNGLKPEDAETTTKLVERLNVMVQSLHQVAKDFSQYVIDRSSFRKFVAEFDFEIAKGFYKYICDANLTTEGEATEIMKMLVERVKKIKK